MYSLMSTGNMRTITKIASLLAALLLLVACEGKELMQPKNFCRWVASEESGLKKSRQMGDVKFSAMFLPASYVALKSMESGEKQDSLKTQMLFDTELQTAAQSEKFVFQIETTSGSGDIIAQGIGSKEEYYQRVVYLSYYIANDFKLLSGKDTIRCEFAQFEQMFNVAPYARVSLIFSKNDKDKIIAGKRKVDYQDMVLLYDDKIWGCGLMKFRFQESDLNNLPDIEI